MSDNPIVLVGAGGQGRAVIEAMKGSPFVVQSYFDDQKKENGPWENMTYRGGFEVIKSAENLPFHLSFGKLNESSFRKDLFNQLIVKNPNPPVVISTKATICDDVTIGKGSVIMINAFINFNVDIGENCVVNNGAIIEHDVSIGSHTHIGPGAVISATVNIGEDCYIANNATIGKGVTIPNGSVVPAGATINAGDSNHNIHPLIFHLERSHQLYQQYLQDSKSYRYACLLLESNAAAIDSIYEFLPNVARTIEPHLMALLNHLESWYQRWTILDSEREFELTEPFVFDTFIPFPKEEYETIKKHLLS